MKINIDNDLYELIHGRRGYFLAGKTDRFIGKSLIEYGEFAELQWKVFDQSVKPGGYVIDAGANIGAHTVAFAQKVGPQGRVFAYEPQPLIFQVLCANLALNALTNVRPYNAACGQELSSIIVPPINYKVPHNYGAFALDEVKDIPGTEVPIFRLDDHYPEKRLDFFKIDVEGMELDVLKGAENLIREYKPVIYTENDRLDHSEELIEFLFNLGYKAWWHRPYLFNPDNFANSSENIFDRFLTTNMLCIHESSDTVVTKLQAVESPQHRYVPPEKQEDPEESKETEKPEE